MSSVPILSAMMVQLVFLGLLIAVTAAYWVGKLLAKGNQAQYHRPVGIAVGAVLSFLLTWPVAGIGGAILFLLAGAAGAYMLLISWNPDLLRQTAADSS